MNSNTNSETGSESPLPPPTLTLEQQVFMLQQHLQQAQQQLQERDKRAHEATNEDERLTKILRATFDAQQSRKEQKISRPELHFYSLWRRKDGHTVLSWLTQFDDYFTDENFSEQHDKITCATNHLLGKASLWWDGIRHGKRPPSHLEHLPS